MKQPLHQNMLSKQRNRWQDLKSLMKNLILKEVLGQRLKRVAPCSKKTLKISDLVWRKLALTQPLKLSLTRSVRQNLEESRLSLKNLKLLKKEHWPLFA